ncbi:MAG: DUF2828 family protein [Candidatus Coproplasma sp.]
MLEELKNQANVTYTENGAVTNASSGSECLDLFATIGALRGADSVDIIRRFIRAYTEDKDIATKILFFARDVRGGLGERRVFRIILKWLACNKSETVKKNLPYIAEYGRYDDLLVLLGTPCEKDALALIKAQFDLDMKAVEEKGAVSLLGKWLPSVNTSNRAAVRNANIIAKYLGMNSAQYRKSLSKLRAYIKIIENNLRERDYTFDYEKQPSKALLKYRGAFLRNDGERYGEFLNRVKKGEAKLNASTVAPYELVAPFFNGYQYCELSEEEQASINATWASLPDYGSTENAIAVIDVSGSMYCPCYKPFPATVALSLGIYFAEHNKGPFKNHFIAFSERPELIEIKGETFADKVRYISTFDDIASTNLEAVFDLILQAAVKNNLPQSDMPQRLYIVSDMEFNMAVENADLSNFDNAKKKYKLKGYNLPEIVFWNVASRKMQQPVTKDENGVILVSGCTPKLFDMVVGGQTNPYAFMMEVLGGERYAKIVA